MASIKLPDQYEVTVDFATDWVSQIFVINVCDTPINSTIDR